MLKQKIAAAVMLSSLLAAPNYAIFAQTGSTNNGGGATAAPAKSVYRAPDDVLAKIKEEGTKNSKVMDTLSYLTDVIGPRLTNSPQMKRANEWTRDTMAKWGMQNAHLEPFGPFGRGWSLKSFSAQVFEPQAFPVIAYPKAWSPGTNGAVTGDVVYLDAKDDAALEKYKGQLKGKIVLVSDLRPLEADFKGMGERHTDEALAKMATAQPPSQPTAARFRAVGRRRSGPAIRDGREGRGRPWPAGPGEDRGRVALPPGRPGRGDRPADRGLARDSRLGGGAAHAGIRLCSAIAAICSTLRPSSRRTRRGGPSSSSQVTVPGQ